MAEEQRVFNILVKLIDGEEMRLKIDFVSYEYDGAIVFKKADIFVASISTNTFSYWRVLNEET